MTKLPSLAFRIIMGHYPTYITERLLQIANTQPKEKSEWLKSITSEPSIAVALHDAPKGSQPYKNPSRAQNKAKRHASKMYRYTLRTL